MQPVLVSRASGVNCLGAGTGAIVAALSDNQSGLRRCDFDTVAIDTYIGRVEGLDDIRVRDDLAALDCRNNRLAQLALKHDGFEQQIAAACNKYGAGRIAVFMGTSTSVIYETELAYRNRDGQSGALPSNFNYAGTQNI